MLLIDEEIALKKMIDLMGSIGKSRETLLGLFFDARMQFNEDRLALVNIHLSFNSLYNRNIRTKKAISMYLVFDRLGAQAMLFKKPFGLFRFEMTIQCIPACEDSERHRNLIVRIVEYREDELEHR